jgi:1-acyl-sn-glycerol-3-phosphate acyltransferase
MNKFLGYLFTPLFVVYYALTLTLFHPIQVLTNYFWGDNARRKSVDVMNLLLVKGLYMMGCRVRFSGLEKIPTNRPIVIVSNHQSLFDIPAIGLVFRRSYPKFISKIELGKNLPSISYNLKHGQSALIDRENGGQAVKEIFKLGKLVEANNYSACIFPEGTRSKDGQVKKFMPAGVNTLLRAAPSAVIVPFVIDGHNRLMPNGKLPLIFGQTITYTVLDAVEPKEFKGDEAVGRVEEAICKALKQKSNAI